MTALSFNKVEIDLKALRDNFLNIRQAVGPQVRVMAVVKADAYGHGLERTARALYQAGARVFGVAETEEGAALRQAGVEGEIIVLLGPCPDHYDDLIKYKLTPVVFDLEVLAGLAGRAAQLDAVVDVHLKVDAGMGRLGILPEQVRPFVEAAAQLSGIRLSGVLSHFPEADNPAARARTREVLERFRSALSMVGGIAADRKVLHIANSAALAYLPDTHLDMVRPGISLYGCSPDGAAGQVCAGEPGLALRPVMSFKTRVIQVKEVAAGTGLSYGHIFVTGRPSRIAVLPVGYDDGYLRKFSNRAQVLIRGQRAPVCGRVCMNACLVDITDLPGSAEIRAGEEVVLLGRQGSGEITADEAASWLETINYEVLCLFGGRNRRVYLD